MSSGVGMRADSSQGREQRRGVCDGVAVCADASQEAVHGELCADVCEGRQLLRGKHLCGSGCSDFGGSVEGKMITSPAEAERRLFLLRRHECLSTQGFLSI